MLSWSRQRRNRTILVGLLLLVVYFVLRAARGALLPYAIALALAYVMLPAIKWLESNLRRYLRLGNASRWLAILIVYLFTIGLVVWFFSIVVPLLLQQFQALWDNRDALSGRLQDLTVKIVTWYRHGVSEQIQTQVDASLQRASDSVIATVQDALARTFTLLTTTVGWILSLTIVPFWLFYVLYDRGKLMQSLWDMLPESYRPDFANLLTLTDEVLGSYIRGQIVLSIATGVMVFAGLLYLHVQFALLFAVMAAVFQFVPIIGPLLGAIPAVIVATIQSPALGLWTTLFYLIVQQLVGSILGPRIAGNSVKLNPAVMLLVLVIGNEIAGLMGMLVAVPLAAILRDIFRYLYMRFQEEPVPADEALDRLLSTDRERRPATVRPFTDRVGGFLRGEAEALARLRGERADTGDAVAESESDGVTAGPPATPLLPLSTGVAVPASPSSSTSEQRSQ